jgi:hypothetical protein
VQALVPEIKKRLIPTSLLTPSRPLIATEMQNTCTPGMKQWSEKFSGNVDDTNCSNAKLRRKSVLKLQSSAAVLVAEQFGFVFSASGGNHH